MAQFYAEGPNKREAGGSDRYRCKDQSSEQKEDAMQLTLKMKEGAMNQAAPTASRHWNWQGNILPESLQREHSPADTFISDF